MSDLPPDDRKPAGLIPAPSTEITINSKVGDEPKPKQQPFIDFFGANDKFFVAFGTRLLAISTIALVVATALLFWSSEKVAHSAHESVEIARDTMINSERAYVFAKSSPSNFRWYPDGMYFTLTYENAGVTPAQHMRSEYYWRFFDGKPPADCPSLGPEDESQRNAFLGPRAEFYSNGIKLPKSLLCRRNFGQRSFSRVAVAHDLLHWSGLQAGQFAGTNRPSPASIRSWTRRWRI